MSSLFPVLSSQKGKVDLELALVGRRWFVGSGVSIGGFVLGWFLFPGGLW